MDKTTNNPQILSFLRRMLDNLCSGRWTILSPPPPPLVTPHQRPAKQRFSGEPYYELHSHPFLEIVQAGSAPALVQQPGQRLTLVSEKLYVILPNVIHAEHPYRANQDYQLLWCVFQATGVSLFINRYHAKTRSYSNPERFGLTSDHALAIAEHIDTTEPHCSFWQAALQARLIQLLIELTEKIQQPPDENFQQHMVRQIRHFIDQHYHQHFTIADLAAMVRCTPNHLNTVFRKHLGCPIHHYILEQRLDLAQRLLAQRDMQIKEIAFRCGFADPLYFSRLYRKKFGQAPTQ